ncbi:MAG: lamin tail domain-containing protein [Chloroflexota bacterium]
MSHSIAPVSPAAATLFRLLIVCLLSTAFLPLGAVDLTRASTATHLVVSEVVTGGASASDELIELYNPTAAALPLEGLELIYVSASGATVSRRAAWELGAPHMPPGSHLLVANDLGIYAAVADATYASGMAATGGSVALRIQGAGSAVDAVGWGTSVSTWLEGTPAPAPAVGGSLERLPGGSAGSTVDTDDNAADFAVRVLPDPQNSGSPPVPDPAAPGPTASPLPTPEATPGPTASGTLAPSPTAVPSAPPGPMPMPIADARVLPDGSEAVVEGTALTASDFTDGGGYVVDAGSGIAVLLDAGSFARGDHVVVRGTVDDRFAQRTLRAGAGDVTLIAPVGTEPAPRTLSTGAVNESVEARLVRIDGAIDGTPTALTGGLAFDVDDGSGATRVIVNSSTGVDTSTWTNGARLVLVGVVGQRDSTGTGSSGYRVQPRDGADVDLASAPSPTPSTGESSGTDPSPTAPATDGSVLSIADARAAAKNARVTVRGVVTLPSGIIDPDSAVIQDASGAILLRLGGDAGSVSRGEVLEVLGVRSTKGGMDSLRVTAAPRRLGSAPDPAPRALRTGEASEASEARLVVVRGALGASARRASSGTVSFEVDDGSGPLRIVLGAALAADRNALKAGSWLEVIGVLGQETTGAQPLRGYRIWPRSEADLRVVASAADGSTSPGGTANAGGADGGGDAADASLAAIGAAGLADVRVGATLVAASWPELGVGGLLWDGARLVGISPGSGARLEPVLDGRHPPLALELTGLREEREKPEYGLTHVSLGASDGDTVVGSAPLHPPATTMPGPADRPAWVSVVGEVGTERARTTIELDGKRVAVERLCRRSGRIPDGVATLVGMAVSSPPRIVLGCEGVRPAPDLALASMPPGSGTPSPSPVSASADEGASAARTGRLLAAGLLAIGSGIMGAAVVVRRRIGAHDPGEAGDSDPHLDQPPAPGPQLTLVRLPNEHGP